MSTSFICDVLRLVYALDCVELDLDTRNIVKSVEAQIQAKLDALERRNTFTIYKTAPVGTDAREAARQKYLDLAGIHENWQSKMETIK
jgi:hypothetical protein